MAISKKSSKPKKKSPKYRIKKNDTVYVLSGKDRGASGKVLEVNPEKDRVTVEGINIVKRHRKESQQSGGGGITEMPAPIHISNLVVVCPHCKSRMRPVKKAIEKTSEGKTRKYNVRACRNCSEQLDTM